MGSLGVRHDIGYSEESQVTAFTWLVDCTMDSFIEAVANLLRIHGDDFHLCSSQFQSFKSFNTFKPSQTTPAWWRLE